MADAQRTVELVFEGTDNTAAATQSALGNTTKLSDSIKAATQPIADFTIAALKVEAAILAAGGAITAFSIGAASNFQSALADLNKVLSDTDNIEQYKDLALELGEKYGVASVEVLKSITNYKTAGFTAQEAGELTKSGLDLVIAGNVEAVQSSNQLVASLKGFGLQASESSRFVDLLNTVSNDYAVTTGQLLEGFSELSPVAKLAGLSLEETIGILTPGIEVFQSGSEMATALRTSLLFMISDAKPVQEALASLGVAQKNTNGELRAAGDIYFDVAKAMQGMSEEQRIFVAEQLVGKNQTSEFLATVAGLNTTLTISGDKFQYLGSAAKEVALQLATAESATNRAKVAFTNLGISIGTPLLDEFSGVADAISAIFLAIGDSVNEGALSGVIDSIESMMAGLQETLAEVAKNLPAALAQANLSGFTDGINAVSDALGGVFGSMDLTSVDGLTRVIETAGAAFLHLSSYAAGVIDSFEPLITAFFDVATGLKDVDAGTSFTAGQIGGFATQVNIAAGVVGDVIDYMHTLSDVFEGIGSVIDTVGEGFGWLTEKISGPNGLMAGLYILIGAVPGSFAAISAGMAELVQKVSELTTGESLSTWASDAAVALGLVDGNADKLARQLEESTTPALQEIIVTAKRLEDIKGPANLSDQLQEISVSARMWGETAEEAADRVERATASQEEWAKGLDHSAVLYDITTGKVLGFGEAAEKTDAALKGAASATNALNVEMQKLESAEMLELIKAKSAENVAQIEADAKKTIAAFESVNTSIKSTGDSLDNLFGLLGDDSISKLDKLDISRQIEQENKLREDAFKLQERLVDAQIKESAARTDALKSGSAMIQISGDGLAPELEAFMWKILQTIQMRVNKDGLDMLLGTGTGP